MSTLLYDLTTGQWSQWDAHDQAKWRAHIGQNWIGMGSTTLARGFGTDIVAGDDETGTLWIMDPYTGVDDDLDDGTIAFTRMVIGGVALDGREVTPCNAVTVNLSLGVPSQIGAEVTLRTSDDFGHSYINHGSQIISAGQYDAVVEWRALGQIKAPGRIFELTDNGAAVRISAADMR